MSGYLMGFLERTFLIFFQTSLTAGILTLIVFAILKIFNNKLSIQVKYLLCSLILLRLIVPVTTQNNIDLNISQILNDIQINNYEDLVNRDDSKFKNNEMKILDEQNIVIEYEQSNASNEDIKNQGNDVLRNIIDGGAVLWCIGIVVLICMLIASLFNFKIESSNLERIKDGNVIKILNTLKQNINLKTDISVYICDDKKSPCILGLIKPKIYLPQYILKLDNDMISHILLHELMHYKRKDLYLNLLCWIMLLLHWFNPLVWIAVKKLKVYREYACDSCVLQILGEEKNMDYGMTIINLSKIIINKRGMQLGLGFERNNVIKGRIEMIKNFKNGSYKMSARAALGCLVAAVIVCTNGITVNALDINISSVENTSGQTNTENKHEFLIDSTTKVYENINKVREIAGFDFKLPDNILERDKPEAYQVIKVSDNTNAIQIYYRGGNGKEGFSLNIFKDDPVEALSKIYESHSHRTDINIESNREKINGCSVDGYIITLKITTPERVIEGHVIPEDIYEGEYFVWKNDGVFYAIPSGSRYEIADLDKIASSLKNIDEIKNVDYLSEAKEELSTEIGLMNIYDKDDLQKAEKILGFNPKLPLIIKDTSIHDSMVGLTSDSDVENNNINYELNSFYRDENNIMTFNQSKHDTFNQYSSAKNNGYINLNEGKINTEKVEVDGHEVYRDMEKDIDEESSKEIISVDYLWEEDGIYYSLTIFNTDGYHDEIVREFINSKTIE